MTPPYRKQTGKGETMNKETDIRLRQLRWNSPWMVLAAPWGLFGIWCWIHQIWNGFSLLSCIFGGVLIVVSALVWVSCLCVITVDEKEIRRCLGPVVLGKMAAREIQSLAVVRVSIGRGGSCAEDVIILSPKKPEDPDRYYDQRLILGWLPAGEGIWLYHTRQRVEQLAKLLPREEKR